MEPALRTLSAVLEVAAWTAVCCAVWLATLSGVTLPELCFALATGFLCGIVARAGRRALGARWSFRATWALWPVPVARVLLIEVAELLGTALVRRPTGRITSIALPRESSPRAEGREAMATLALCSTPGTVVADLDPEGHRLTVHSLELGPDLEPVVRR